MNSSEYEKILKGSLDGAWAWYASKTRSAAAPMVSMVLATRDDSVTKSEGWQLERVLAT